jgi:hypothetical protein
MQNVAKNGNRSGKMQQSSPQRRRGTLTTFGFALNISAHVTCWTLTALRSGLDVSSMVRYWTLTALRSGLDISNLVRSFKSGCDLL